MSHFTVTVRLASSVGLDRNAVEEKLHAALLPFKESGAGSDDPEGLDRYLRFRDTEDDYRKDYEEKSSERLRLPDGSLVSKYNDRFRRFDPKTFTTTYEAPPGQRFEDVPHRVAYPTFEAFMEDWTGNEARDLKTGRYGYWQNPNKKWGWWTIGGRWSGSVLPADICRISDLDFRAADGEAAEKAKEWIQDWNKVLATGKDDSRPFEGPRDTALRLGVLVCKDEDELTAADRKLTLIEWTRQIKNGKRRFDVLKPAPALDDILPLFDPFATYARLDASCPDILALPPEDAWKLWQEPGKMGWFACSTETPETHKAFKESHRDWLKRGDPRDVLVLVDCHI